MSRKSLLLTIGIVVLLVGGTAGTLALLLLHEPDSYQHAAVPPGPQRKDLAKEFLQLLSDLYTNIYNNDQDWCTPFTQEQINSYLEEDFVCSHQGETLLPEGISAPRVAIEPEKIRLAFRYGSDQWSTVISIDLRPWLVAKEPNVIALELRALHAGSLPVTAQSLLDRISDVAQQQNIEVTWYRHNGNPVALVRFEADKPRPTIQLRQLKLLPGKIVIAGGPLEASPIRAMLSPALTDATAN